MTVDHKDGFVANGGGQVNNGYGTNQPPNVNLDTGVNVWGNQTGIVGNGAIGVQANGTPTGPGPALGISAFAKPKTADDSTGVLVMAFSEGLSTRGVDATAASTSTSTNPLPTTIGIVGVAEAKEGPATGVFGSAVTESTTALSTGVSGSAITAVSPAVGVSGSAQTENGGSATGVSGSAQTESGRGPATGVPAYAFTENVDSPAIGVSATAATDDNMATTTGVAASATGMVGWGISASGPKGGRFASARLSAQINLVPQGTPDVGTTVPVTPTQFGDPGPILPQVGDVGDFWFSMTGKPGNERGSLWVCVASSTGSASAQWSQVLLGQAFPGQAI
jgi:hypothetical protein